MTSSRTWLPPMAKFGWCLEPLPHQNCRRSFKSNGKTYVCDCPCHLENDKLLEELI